MKFRICQHLMCPYVTKYLFRFIFENNSSLNLFIFKNVNLIPLSLLNLIYAATKA